MTAPEDLTVATFGPLLSLIGTWEGETGVDFSYHHADRGAGDTPFVERATFTSFGPVDNGDQHLYGLDYRMAAWRATERDQDPFHTEVGYWLYDPAARQIMRVFMVPRGVTVIAGGTCEPEATSFELAAELGSTTYGVLDNPYLAEHSSTTGFRCTITIGEGEWSYEEDCILRMDVRDEVLHHTDRNTLTKVSPLASTPA